MAVSSQAVANFILDLGDREGIDISPMKLQKLVYYAHGWHLAVVGDALIDEQVEAWPYGPVVRSLFLEFKGHGASPIKGDRACPNDDVTSLGLLEHLSAVAEIENETDESTSERMKSVIRKVWDEYKGFSAERLSNMTHEPGSPWSKTVEKYQSGQVPKGTDISQGLIKQYFIGQMTA